VARVLLAVGSAPGLYEDLAAAKALYPDAEVMLINGACAAVEEAQHILAGHTEKAEEFVAARDKAFPFALPYRESTRASPTGTRPSARAGQPAPARRP
jgi:hypothetical protein